MVVMWQHTFSMSVMRTVWRRDLDTWVNYQEVSVQTVFLMY